METARRNPNIPQFLQVVLRLSTIAIVITSDYEIYSVGTMLKAVSVTYLWENMVESLTSNDQYEVLTAVIFRENKQYFKPR